MTGECAILLLDYGMYVREWENNQCEYTVDVREAKRYEAGPKLMEDLKKLRKAGYRVTATDEEMGWL